MTLNAETIKNFIEENKESEEVQTLVKGFKTMSAEDVTAFLEKEENQSILESLTGKRIAKFKEGKMQDYIKEALKEHEKELEKKYNPPKNPLEEEVREIKAELAKERAEKKFAKLNNLVIKALPTELHEFSEKLIGIDEDTTQNNVSEFLTKFDTAVNKAVQDRLQVADIKNSNVTGGISNNPWDPKTYSLTEQGKILRNDREKARRLAKQFGVILQ